MSDHADLLIPVRRRRTLDGRFVWPSRLNLSTCRLEDRLPLAQLQCDLRQRLGSEARVRCDAWGEASVRIIREPGTGGRDAYRLTVASDGIRIAAATDAGAYYAIQTLRDLVRIHGASLPACRIDDHPDFARRGVYLDCSRGKVPTVKTLKALVEQLGAWKVNELQLYVENVFTFGRHPAIGRGFSPLRPQDLLNIQDHCQAHHIDFVPSIASFGHMETILALPEYRHLAELPETHGRPGGTTLSPVDRGSIRLIEELYEEFIPLFKATDVNVCCDETWELGRGRSTARAKRDGVGRVYLDFLLRLRQLCEKHGKRMNAWADIILNHPELLSDVPRDMVMLNWDYAVEPRRAARSGELAAAGLPFVVCPGTHCWLSHGTRLQDSVANVRRCAKIAREHGADGLLNTNWGDCGHRNPLGLSLHGFAHGAAHAWHGKGVRERDFTDRFCHLVFGERDGQLAGLLRELGKSERRVGTRLYLASVELFDPQADAYSGINAGSPVWRPLAHRGDPLGQAKADGAQEVIEAVAPARRSLPETPAETLHPFLRQAVMEIGLAADLDLLTARRILAAQAWRNGASPSRQLLSALADETEGVAKRFETLWRQRNRPSRLRDNLVLFRRTVTELRQLARRTD